MANQAMSLNATVRGETSKSMRGTFRLVVQLILIAVVIWVIATVPDSGHLLR